MTTRTRSVLITLALVATLTTSASAQQSTPPTPGAPETSVTLTVTQSELAIIGKALAKLPFEEVAGLFNKLQQQVTAAQGKPPSSESGK